MRNRNPLLPTRHPDDFAELLKERAQIGDERARPQIAEQLRPKGLRNGPPVLVDPNGRPLH